MPKESGRSAGNTAEGKRRGEHEKSKRNREGKKYVNRRRREKKKENGGLLVEWLKWSGGEGKWRTITGVADQLVPARDVFLS
jgi:hypothetical protein